MSVPLNIFPQSRRTWAPRFTVAVAVWAVLAVAIAVPVKAQDEDIPKAEDAVSLFQKGQDAHEKGQLAEAIALYEKAIAETAEFPEAEFQRGHALLSLGRKDEAEKAFRRAVQIRPEWTLALANLGSLLVSRGSYQEAEKLLLKAISIDDENALAFSALTELRIANKAKPEELRELLTRLNSLTSKARPTAGAWAAKGAIEAALSENAAARTSFDKALELEPKNTFALSSKAGLALDEGDLRTAESLVKQLETLNPAAHSSIALRSRIMYAGNNVDGAVAHLSTIKDPPPDVAELRDRMVLSKSESAAELERRLERNAGDAFVLGKLCSLYRVSNPAKALAYCRKASEAEPGNLSHATGFAAALVQGKLYTEAVGLLQKLKTLSPENETIRANLATALFQLKRYPEAKAEFQWITENNPATSIAFYFLAIAHDQLTEYLDAMANYQLFLKNADPEKHKIEIEKVNLRLPVLQKQIKEKKGKRF
jgi:tetratricopeptide (TPR) repeat protein